MTITSPSNRHLIEIRKLSKASARRDSGRFVIEGEDLYEAAVAARVDAHYVLCAQGHAAAREQGCLEVEPELLARVSALGSSSRLIGVYEQRWVKPRGPLAVALWGVRDPGNVGTVVRAAQAFGASCVALGGRCADPYGPKAVRASMGAIFGTRIASVNDVAEMPGRVVALVPSSGSPLRGPLSGEVTLLLGAERDGLPAALLEACDEVCSIGQAAGDSLNVAMAATVALYEATRMAPA